MRFAVLALLALVLSACAAPHAVRVAIDARHPPLAFRDAHDQLVGYEVDVFRAVAADAGWTMEFVPTTTEGWIHGSRESGIFGGLDRGDWDLVVAALPESNQLRDFGPLTHPYLMPRLVVVAPRTQPFPKLDATWTGLLGWAGYELPGPLASSAVPRWTLRDYRDTASALDDLVEGRLDAVAAPALEVATQRLDNERVDAELTVTAELPASSDAGLVAVGRDADRVAAVDQALVHLESSGALAALRARWKIP